MSLVLAFGFQFNGDNFYMHRASALFVGVYEPTKQKLLKLLPENLSAVAHLVRDSSFSSFLTWIHFVIMSSLN